MPATKTTKNHSLNVAKKMWKHIPHLSAVAQDLKGKGTKNKTFVTLPDTLYSIYYTMYIK